MRSIYSVELEAIGPSAYIVNDLTTGDPDDSDAEDTLLPQTTTLCIPKMCELQQLANVDSDCSSSSEDEDEDESRGATPLPDDTNSTHRFELNPKNVILFKCMLVAIAVFLSEVIDSLSRGFREKSNPDFLILEINSSRYAYNMSLKEVNFNVVKAVFGMQSIVEPPNNNVLAAINAVFKQLGPVVSNYIKSEDAMLDCLKALEVLNAAWVGFVRTDSAQFHFCVSQRLINLSDISWVALHLSFIVVNGVPLPVASYPLVPCFPVSFPFVSWRSFLLFHFYLAQRNLTRQRGISLLAVISICSIGNEFNLIYFVSFGQDICEENELVREKISQVVHYLYDKDFVSEDAIHAWYSQLDVQEHATLRQSLAKLVDWLNQSSEDDDDGDDDDDDDE